jgi:hypothetical protein
VRVVGHVGQSDKRAAKRTAPGAAPCLALAALDRVRPPGLNKSLAGKNARPP